MVDIIARGATDPLTGETELDRKFRGQPRKRILEDRNRTGIGPGEQLRTKTESLPKSEEASSLDGWLSNRRSSRAQES